MKGPASWYACSVISKITTPFDRRHFGVVRPHHVEALTLLPE
jgi:hypothetical protein